MLPLATLLSLQAGLSAKQPAYFALVFIGLLILGGIAWLIAAVLGFARARAFGAATRWFSFAAVCLLIYHIQFILLGFVTFLGAQQNDFDSVRSVFECLCRAGGDLRHHGICEADQSASVTVGTHASWRAARQRRAYQ